MANQNRAPAHPIPVRLWIALAPTLAFGIPAATLGQPTFDFDTTGPTTTAELLADFDFFGFAPEVETNWTVQPNAQNAANPTNALHTSSDVNQLEPWFSRVAILKTSVFEAQDVELSAEITWDDLGGDANDNAGLYLRFRGTSDVPLENTFYHVRIGIDNGPPSTVYLHRVKEGVHTQLFSVVNTPFPVSEGDTVTMGVRAEGNEIFVWIDGIPIPGLDPFVDDDPILGPGRVGVGQETNPSYFDNLTLLSLEEPGFPRDRIEVAAIDPSVNLGLRIAEECARPVVYTIVPTVAGVVSPVSPAMFGPGDEFRTVELTIEGPGTTVLNTTNDRGCDDYTVMVTVHALQGVQLQLPRPAMKIGDAQQATVIGDFGPARARDLTDQATFSVEPPSGVVTVSAAGLIVAVGEGTAEVAATVDGISGRATVVVADLPRQTDPDAPHIDGILDYTPFRFVGRAGGEPDGNERRWGDLWGYDYDGTDPALAGHAYAYVGVDVNGSGMAIFDITDPTQPFRVGTYAPAGEGGLMLRDVEVYDGIGYFSSNNGGGVHVVDVRADPADPPLLKRVTSADDGNDRVHRLNLEVTDRGTFLYEAGSGSGIAVFDVSDPRTPSSIVKVGHINEASHDTIAKRGRLYVSRGSNMPVYDVTDIKNGNARRLVQFSSGSGTHSSATSENDAYVYIGHEGGTRDLRVYNLRDVRAVTEVVSRRVTNGDLNAGDLSNVHNQFVAGDFLFNAWSEAGLTVHDIRNPRRPILVGTFDTAADHSAAAFEGAFGVYPGLGFDRVLVSDRESGLWIVDITPPGDFDTDMDVDLADFLAFLACVAGPGQPVRVGCERADFDGDGDADLADLVVFQARYTGPQ